MKNKLISLVKKKYYIILLLIIFFFLLFTVIIPTFTETTTSSTWDGKVATSFHSGNGTINSPYEINTGSELAYFKSVSTSSDFFNKYYILTNNINLNNFDFSNINYGTFSGNFNAQSYSIYNFTINNNSTNDADSTNYYGLFGNLYNSTISNLNLSNITINVTKNANVGLLANNATNTTISNVSVNKLTINNNNSTISGGGLYNNDVSGNTIHDISIDTSSNSTIGSLIGTYNNATLTNVLVKNNGLNSYNNGNNNDLYIYSVDSSNNVTFNNNYSTTSILDNLNSNNVYTWKLTNGLFQLTNNTTMALTSMAMTTHSSGIAGSIVYVNDIDRDNNYYQSLNFTYSSSAYTLPTLDNKNVYNDNNLVNVELNYFGHDANNNYTGTVSPTESQNEYIYYKRYAVNNNNTTSTSDDYLLIELIDNPFTNRPNNMGFNGWTTDYAGAKISYTNDYYTRYIKVPITYNNNIPNNIVLNIYASWTPAKIASINSTNWTNAFSTLDTKGMKLLSNQSTYANKNMSGFYALRTIPYNSSQVGFYNASGVELTGTCSTYSGCSAYELMQYYKSDGTSNIYDSSTSYYYFATRDTNIIFQTGNLSSTWASAQNKPFTLTAVNNGTDNRSKYYWSVSSITPIMYADTTIENIRINGNAYTASGEANPSSSASNKTIYGNYNNLKIGRGITQYNSYYNSNSVVGGAKNTNNVSTVTKYRLIIESGIYNSLSLTAGTNDYTTPTLYLLAKGVYGSDYDRVKADNSKLNIVYCASGSWGGNIQGYNTTDKIIDLDVKSGTYGSNHYDYTTGIYVGGRYGGNHYGTRSATIEGGIIYNINGGPLSDSSQSSIIDTIINIQGGSIDMVYGGAGLLATYGSKLITLTGGTINYSVFGGSNGYAGSDGDGTINGSTYIYTGGDTTIGSSTNVSNNNTLWNAEAGSIFGIGNGNSNYASIGTCNNSNIIINGGTINRNIYGGGNYGATGISSSSSTTTSNINIVDGQINGSVYGAGNNNGAGSSSISSNININMTGGSISGSVFGGAHNLGTVYGSTNLNINAGNIDSDIYGGGEGGYTSSNNQGTFISKNTNVSIGTSTTSPSISGDIYGGSAYGTVNANSISATSNNNTTTVNIINGNITGSIYGGSKGSTTFTPYIKGNILVNINGGVSSNIYGGCNQNGNLSGSSTINLNGGLVGNVYGGGKNVGLNTTNINLKGSTISDMFGGSNLSGNVQNTNITTTSGKVNNIYGGNNLGGVVSNTNVIINGGYIYQDIYGGGNASNSTTTNIDLKTSSNTINNVYGGGKNADATTTNLTIEGVTATNIYGGSNLTGTINNSYINMNSGTITNIYGGNNQGGTTTTTNLTSNGGTTTSIYGGGNATSTATSNLTVNAGTITNAYAGGDDGKVDNTNFNILGGTIENAFGAGNNAGADTTNIQATQGKVTSLYGGANQSGDVTTSTINTKSNNETIPTGVSFNVTSDVKAVTWESTTYSTVATLHCIVSNNSGSTLNKWNVFINVPNSIIFSNYSNSNIASTNGYYSIDEINRYYGINSINNGSTYSFDFTILTNTPVSEFGISKGLATRDILMINNLYGGNNQGGVTSTTNLLVHSGIINNLYGGGRQTNVDDTNVDIYAGTIGNVYGGGDTANVNHSTNVNMTGGLISTNFYGGGNAGEVLENTNVYVSSGTITCSLYAGGNGTTATVYGNTNITISGNTIVGYKGAKAPNYGSVFGGGKAATTGTQSSNASKAIVNIAGGYMYGNIYGGANTAAVYGQTEVNIGKYVNITDDVVKGDITILGTIFGGGEANAAGSENYDYSFISVTNGINVNIDGDTYNNLNLSGSIFGSGDASSTSGVSTINIKNYGTYSNPEDNISIQRTNNLIIDNSNIHLTGATDRTNEYSDTLFTLSIIDELDLKNNSTLYLENGANLLKSFKSMDSSGNLETVNIDDANKKTTTNVNNRLYMLINKNLNIATNESVTSYGTVYGMTFFGSFQKNSDGSLNKGIYDANYKYGDALSWSDLPDLGAYILGLHKSNHNYNADGFYTNYIDATTTTNKQAVIKPSPDDVNYYMWIIGDIPAEYEINLTASKYSTLGTVNLPMRDFAKPNTTFNVIKFDSTGLADGITLTNESNVPRIASSTWSADRNMALVMENSSSGWLNDAKTSFINDATPNVVGDKAYIGENTSNIPNLSFYLYHSKNLSTNGNMGSVKITLLAVTKIDDLTNETKRVVITVNLSRALYTTNDYEGSITPGRKYSLFNSSNTNITNNSSLSAYFSMYDSTGNIYQSGYHRSLVSSYVLPLNTKITMIDMSNSNPIYYYHVINSTDVTNAQNELAKNTDNCSYNLSLFELMGTQNSNQYYDDSSGNTKYYHDNASSEEFIFIFDFENANINSDLINKSLLMELRNSSNATVKSVLSAEYANMKYSIYTNNDTKINTASTIDKTNIYAGQTAKINLTTTYNSTNVSGSSDIIQDTKYYDSKMGVKISLLDSNNNIVSGTSLMGLYYDIDGVQYHPNMDGTVRIKIADKVGNCLTRINLVTNNATMATGDYKIHIETFGSPDGIYFGLVPSSSSDINVKFINQNYGLDIKATDDSQIIDHITGYNLNKNNSLSFNINYNSTLTNPHIDMKLYRRSYETIYDNNYDLVDLKDYVSSALFATSKEKEYLVVSNPNDTTTLGLPLKSNLKTGTYKLEFILYDGDTVIDSINKYIIIK